MITAESVAAIGTALGTDPSVKKDPQTQQLQATINLTSVLQCIALVLIDIRDGKKDPSNK
jgi:hypothetical protein